MLNCLSFLWYVVNRSQLYHGIHTFYINPKYSLLIEGGTFTQIMVNSVRNPMAKAG